MSCSLHGLPNFGNWEGLGPDECEGLSVGRWLGCLPPPPQHTPHPDADFGAVELAVLIGGSALRQHHGSGGMPDLGPLSTSPLSTGKAAAASLSSSGRAGNTLRGTVVDSSPP
jgi:hypothetical protein